MDDITLSLEIFAWELLEKRNPLKRAFGDHLLLVIKAIIEIEEENNKNADECLVEEAIRNALGNDGNKKILGELIKQAQEITMQLENQIAEAQKELGKDGGEDDIELEPELDLSPDADNREFVLEL